MKITATILSIVILIQGFNISCSDILNLNELVEHAQFHKKAYNDSFVTFLSKHYGDLKKEHAQKHQEEKEEHEKLPFQFDYHLVDFTKVTFHNLEIALYPTPVAMSKKTVFYYQDIYTSPDAIGIFQPPRFA